MKKAFLLFAIIFLFGCPVVFGQVIDLDEEPAEVPLEGFEKSTIYYVTPFSSFTYNLGYSNMRQTLNFEFDLNQRRLGEFISMGVGWRKKLMFYNITAAIPIIGAKAESLRDNTRTIAETKDAYFDFTVGRAVVTNDRYYLILRAGGGMHVRSIQLRQVERGSFDLNGLQSNPSGRTWPLMEHFLGTWDVAVEYMPRAFRKLSVMESVQLGYKGGIGAPVWRSSEMNIENSFADRVSVLYLRVLIVISRER